MTLTFDLHNRHTYSEELIKTNRAYRHYTATIGVLTADNTLLTRAVVQNEFRTAADLVDRVSGGAGPGGVKAVAPTGTESIIVDDPRRPSESVSILGEKLTVIRAGRHRQLHRARVARLRSSATSRSSTGRRRPAAPRARR